MANSSFAQQTGALFKKNWLYQKRSILNNLGLITGPLFICILLYVLQTIIDNQLAQSDRFKCGCQCTQCCKIIDGVQQCKSLDYGTCDTARGFVCRATNDTNCGAQFSSPIQAVWCPVESPSVWPPVMHVARPSQFAPPLGPYKATPVAYTSDPGSTDAADRAAAQMFQLPNIKPQNLNLIMDVFKRLITSNSVFNGDELAKLGFQFGSARRAPWQSYLDDAFINGGGDLDVDTLLVLMPNDTCAQRNMSFTGPNRRLSSSSQPAAVLTPTALVPANTTVAINTTTTALNTTAFNASSLGSNSGRYNFTSFMLKFFSYDYPNLPELLQTAGINISQLTDNALLGGINLACVDMLLWQLPSQEAMDLTFWCGFRDGYPIPPSQCNKSSELRVKTVEGYSAGWNFLNTSKQGLSVDLIYNRTLPASSSGAERQPRLSTLVNLAVRGWLKAFQLDDLVKGNELLGLMAVPKPATKLRLDFSSLLGPLFYAWVVQLLVPVFLQQLVYEKEKRLRMMMKMHGLKDSVYWLVTYLWYLFAVYCLYMLVFMISGYAIGLQYFKRTSLGVQLVFYFLFGQTQLAFTFLLSCAFKSSRTAVAVGYLYLLATGLIGYLLLSTLMDEGKWWMWIVQLLPAFSLYRGLYELGAYAFLGVYTNTPGMQWSNLSDPGNGMITAWIILAVEWPILMALAWYLEQVTYTGNGAPRHPLFFLDRCLPYLKRKRASPPGSAERSPHSASSSASSSASVQASDSLSATKYVLKSTGSGSSQEQGQAQKPAEAHNPSVAILAGDEHQEPYDVKYERLRSQRAFTDNETPIVCQSLRKEFTWFASKTKKVAVKDLSIAVSRGECFGLLGPNGAGKSTFIHMLTGLLTSTSGTARIEGLDIHTDMSSIYNLMGVCPQHDLLWEQLTAREHLRFYGRLKGLEGAALEEAIDAALKGVNLYTVGNKRAGKYSGGMKRRLSVAISFMGSPKVVYLDEPSTGLDPASRRNLWDVVEGNKEGRSIILTTHSMEEAEQLCDRLGIFVDGQLVCIGNPKEITSRYAGFYVFTITVPASQEPSARQLVASMSPGAVLTYALGGTLKYELPSNEVTLSSVFEQVNAAKARGLEVVDWGVANATLEEAFIKLAKKLNLTMMD